MGSTRAQLRIQVDALRARVPKLRSTKGVNEQSTKASLIVPLLAALGWDTSDTDEVQYEYRRRGSENPVDFALMVRNEPVLFIEAKTLGTDLTSGKATNQLVSYATQSGVSWSVLTDGVEYHIYNAHAAVPLEDKLLRKLSLERDAVDEFVDWMALLSKSELTGKRIDRVWESAFVDAQVRRILERELASDAPGKRAIGLIVDASKGSLSPKDVAAALRRGRFTIAFPPMPAEHSTDATSQGRRPTKLKLVAGGKSKVESAGRATLEELIRTGHLKPPTEIASNYRGHQLTATIRPDGTIRFDGVDYPSLSAAGAAARKPFFAGELVEEAGPATNGWGFWRIRDPATRKEMTVDAFARQARNDPLARGRAE